MKLYKYRAADEEKKHSLRLFGFFSVFTDVCLGSYGIFSL